MLEQEQCHHVKKADYPAAGSALSRQPMLEGGAAGNPSVEADWWKYVDSVFATAIENYEKLTIKNRQGETQSIFVDLIVKLKICRAFANSMNQKPLTAHRYLKEAENMIARLRAYQPSTYHENATEEDMFDHLSMQFRR